MKHPLMISIVIGAAVACAASDRVDQKKFDAIYRAGKALQVEVRTTGGTGNKARELNQQFKTEVSMLQGRTSGKRDAAALQAFVEASDAYDDFLRFRSLDLDAPKGLILLMGRRGLLTYRVKTAGSR